MSKSTEQVKTFYDILNSKQHDSLESIKREYQSLVLKWHPDKKRADNAEQQLRQQEQQQRRTNDDTHMEFHHIDEAWKVLRDPVTRRAYDMELNQHKFNEKGIVHDTLTIDEFDVDEENEAYSYLCRCGGYFMIPRDELSNDPIAPDEEILINCDECSLVIKLAR